MMRLIDADKMQKQVNNILANVANEMDLDMKTRIEILARIANIFYEQKTVDAVPVVRCKDCMFCRDITEQMDDQSVATLVCVAPEGCGVNVFEDDSTIVAPEWYCADGVRKESKQDG